MTKCKRMVILTAQGRNTFTEEQALRLEAAGDVSFVTATYALPDTELVQMLGDAEIAGLTPRSVPVIGASWLDRAPRLQGIAVFATGVDYIDTELLRARGIALSHLPDYSTVSVAEHTMGMLLTMSRRIHLSQDRVRGRVPASTSVQGWELRVKTLGIVGLGRIGSYVAKLASAFEMRVLAYDPAPRTSEYAQLVTKEELLSSSDIVSLHYPSYWQAPPDFGAAELSRFKSGAWLLNASRWALVDSEAVIAAIEAGQLRGYALDEIFPLPDRAAKLIEEGRILQTGHTAWYSAEVIARGYETWVDNLVGLATGEPRNLTQPVGTEGKGGHRL
ncbi:2-hydroxyacid dehydrogenase [Paenibacillus swuensis]|uniref:2-hydroxyacid dehydrogenase n=1 Tax=Paenibacillus swuensis TaxID=1178515 RepID=UPI00083845D8|nr:2-hydroxyacid dehydrogenase [Paenibacillus swuensis]